MIKGYKKSYLLINTLLFIILAIAVINLFIYQNSNYLFSNVLLSSVFMILFTILGFEKKKRRFTYESMFYVFSITIIYLVITYFIGIKIGFNANIYKFNMISLIKNILPYTYTIIISELLRYEIIRKGEKSTLSYILITMILIIIDCTLFINSFDLSTGDGEIKYIFYIVLPSISKNTLLLYLTKIGGVYPSIIYRLIMDLKMFLLPIFPDFGYYFDTILNVSYPIILGVIINNRLEQYKNEEVNIRGLQNSKLFTYSSVIAIIIMVLIVITLASGKFRYGMISIGSGSMTGTINKGDVVIYENIDETNLPKVGEILVFKKENKIVVHRIIRIRNVNDEFMYYTKGDANNDEDGYPIIKSELVGVVKKRVKYIGIPSVAINELTHK